MNMETIIDQPVIYDQRIYEHCKATGKIIGRYDLNLIILLDRPLRDGTKAVLVPSDIVHPLACHWCRDTKKVSVTPITGAQFESNDIPQKDCPYC
jgi:hypothetical protein